MTFSIIVTTWGDHAALARTLANLIYQSRKDAPREIIVAGDGYEVQAQEVVETARAYARHLKQAVTIRYLFTSKHYGTGNIPRAYGLRAATGDFVCFIDSGCCVQHRMFELLNLVLQDSSDVDFINWGIVQMVDPVPWDVPAIDFEEKRVDTSQGLPYCVPGVGAAVRRTYAQMVEWPNCRASDWAYYTRVWNVLPKRDNGYPKYACLTMPMVYAYAGKTERKLRLPSDGDEKWLKRGCHRGFTERVPNAD